MICCLLALLAALPGVSLIRRIQAGRVLPARCALHDARALRRDIGMAVAAAGTMVVVFGGVLSIHKWTHGMYWQGTAPICSALNPVSPVLWRDLRATEPYR